MGKHRHHKRDYSNNSSSSSSSSSYTRHKHHGRRSHKQPDAYTRAGKDTRIFCYVGMVIGALLMLISMGILIYFNAFYKDNYVKTSGKVVNAPFCSDPKNCSVTISYSYDGKPYNINKTYDPTFTKHTYVVGELVTLYVNPNNPMDVKLDTEHLDVRTLNIVFSILLVIGLLKLLFFYYFRKNPFVCGFYGLSWFLGGRK